MDDQPVHSKPPEAASALLRWQPGFWLVGYVVLMIAVAVALIQTRSRVLQSMDTSQATEDWLAWRETVARESEQPGPVQRRIPRSTEPPALILMRDYFAVVLGISLLSTTVLYAFFVLVVCGMLKGRRQPVHAPSMTASHPR